MDVQKHNRRSFITGIVPACFGTYRGMRSLTAFTQSKQEENKQENKHKFDQQMKQPLTLKQYFEIEYVSHFIPFLNILEMQIGKERVIAALKKLAVKEADEFAKSFVEEKGKNDITVFKHYGPDTPGIKNMLTIEVLEETDEAYAIKITECIWAKVFRDADAADYGYAAVCCGDVPFARAVNPNIDLDLKGTIMQGKPSCTLRYYVKS